MIHTVYYEPQSQRPRFEPREQQWNDLWQMHLRLSFHFHLDLGARLRRTSRSIVARVTTIFAAFMGALALVLSPYWTQAHSVQTPPMLDALFGLARIAGTWLRFANHLSRLVAGGMVLMFIGVVPWRVTLALAVPGGVAMLVPRLPLAIGVLLAVMVALWASFWPVQPPASQPRPHDASPSELDSSGEPWGYRG